MSPRALITGAAKRIGRAIALDLAAAGWDIVIHFNHSQAEAESLAHEIHGLGSEAWLAQIDLSDSNLVSRLIPQLTAEIGPLSALINNASLFEPDAADPGGLQHAMINLHAPRLLSQAFRVAERDPSAPSSVILNLLDAHPFIPHFSGYTRSKVALAALTEEMALEFAPDIRVNGLALGYVLPGSRQSEAHFEDLVRETPLQRRIAVDTVAQSALFLIENPSITGVVLNLDAGLHLGKLAGFAP